MMTERKIDILGELPTELAEMILLYLTPDDVINCSRISKRWRLLVNNDHVWSKLLPRHEYAEKSWPHLEICDEVEGCRLMNRYLTEARVKNNLKQGKYTPITTRPSDSYPGIDNRNMRMEFSSDLRLLAARYRSFAFIYERKNSEFDLLSLLAVVPPLEEEAVGSTVLTLVCCPKLDKQSIGLFLRDHSSTNYDARVRFFTGTASPNERRVCLMFNRDRGPYQFVLWDVDRNRLVHTWHMRTNYQSVFEGWAKRGVCLIHHDESSTARCIQFYDVDWQLIRHFPVNWNIPFFMTSYDFFVAIRDTDECSQLVMWNKDSRKHSVLMESNEYGLIPVGVESSYIACGSTDGCLRILTAPDWVTVAKVDLRGYPRNFCLTEFSDGSLFFTTSCSVSGVNEYIWYDIDRRNKTEKRDRFKLPKESSVSVFDEIFAKGHLLALFRYDDDDRKFPTIFDYNYR